MSSWLHSGRRAPATAALLAAGCSGLWAPPPADTAPPSFHDVVVSPEYVRPGSVVLLTFRVSEPLPPDARRPRPNPEVRIGGRELECQAEESSYRCTATIGAALAEGEHEFVLVGRDAAGNESGAFIPAVRAKVDRTAPLLEVFASPDPALRGQPVVFVVTAGEDLGAPPAIRASFLEGAPVCAGAGTLFVCRGASISGTAPRQAAFVAVGTDRAGNEGTSAQAILSVRGLDETPPVMLGFRADPVRARAGAVVTLRFESTEPLPAGARGARPNPEATFAGAPMDCAADGPAYRCTASAAWEMGEGERGFTVIGADAAGNERLSDAPEASVVLDFTPPQLVAKASPEAVAPGELVVLLVEASEPIGGVPALSAPFLEGVPSCSGADTRWTCQGTVSLGAALGTTAFFASAADLAGNVGTSAAGSVEVLETPPRRPQIVLDELSPNPAKEGDELRIRFSADEPLTSCAAFVGGQNVPCLEPAGAVCECGLVVGGAPAEGRATVVLAGAAGGRTGIGTGTLDLDRTAPVVDGSLVSFVRHPAGADDAVRGASGAAVDRGTPYARRRVVAVRLWDAADAASPRLTVAVDEDGGFAETPIPQSDGTAPQRLAPAVLWASAVDVPGNEGPRVQILPGRGTGLAAQGGRIAIRRRDLTAPDGVEGLPGAFASACALLGVRLFESAEGAAAVGTVAPRPDGGFAEVPVGSATRAPARVWAEAADKCGGVARAEALVGRDVTAPGSDPEKLSIVRRGLDAADGLVGAAGAVVDETSVVVLVSVHDAPAGGRLVATASPEPDGAIAEVPVGTASSSFARLWIVAQDKAGNVSEPREVAVGAAQGPLVVNGARLVLHRRRFGARDGIEGAAGTVVDACAAAAVVFDAPVDGRELGRLAVAADGGFSELLVGEEASAPAEVWVAAVDKCGRVSAPTPAPSGEGGGLFADPSRLVIRRRDTTQRDGLAGLAGAFVHACALRVSVHAAEGGDGALGVVEAGADGSFPEVPVGTPASSYPRLWVEAKCKCGGVERVEAAAGRDATAPTADPARLQIVRRGFDAADGVAGGPGAVADATSALVSVSVLDAPTGGGVVGTTRPVLDGSFPEVPVGMPSASFARLWIVAQDKAGNISEPQEILTGARLGGPLVDGTRLVVRRRPFGAKDGIDGAPGAVVGACASVAAVYDAPEAGRELGRRSVAADGSFPELLAGSEESAPAELWVAVSDKCGRTSAREQALTGSGGGEIAADARRLVVERRDLSHPDGLFGLAGALVHPCALRVSVHDAAAGGSVLGTVSAAGDGSFPEVAVGTAAASYPRLWVEAAAKCGPTARVEALVGRDTAPPAADPQLMRIVRRDLSEADAVAGLPGAVVDETSAIAALWVFDAPVAGNLAAAPSPGPDGAFDEAPVGTAASAPARLWIVARDKAGNVSEPQEIVLGSAPGEPAVDGALLTLHRRPFGAVDGLEGGPDAVLGACAAVASVFDAPLAGLDLGHVPVLGDGSFPELPVGDEDASPPDVWVEVRDKCGRTSQRARAVVGGGGGEVVADGERLVIVRRDLTEPDAVAGMHGAFATPCALVVSVHDALVGGNDLGGTEVDPDGSFPEVSVGSAASSHGQLWVQTASKCGAPAARFEALTGRDTEPPALDETQAWIVRRGFDELDGVLGRPGAVQDATSALVTVWLHDAAAGGGALGATSPLPDGSFVEVPLGTPSSSVARVWLSASDKAGNVSAPQEVVLGGGPAEPVVDGTRVTLRRNPFGVSDGILGDPGAVSGACAARVRVFDAPEEGAEVASALVAADGSFPERAVGSGNIAPAQLWVAASDKCGRASARTAALVGVGGGVVVGNPDRLVVHRRDRTARDGLSGMAGAFEGACAMRIAVYGSEWGDEPLGRIDAGMDGSFPEVPVGSEAWSLPRLWAEATDKCMSASQRIEALTGRDVKPPVIDGSRFVFGSEPAGVAEEVSAGAGAVLEETPGVLVEVYAAQFDPAPVATLVVGRDGAVAPQTVGEIHHPPQVVAVDKAGNRSQWAGAGPDYESPRWPVPDSPTLFCSDGATEIACPATGGPAAGQDADYRRDVPTYVTTDETVTDTVTGLVWERHARVDEVGIEEAFAYCDNLVLAGRYDWRLPTLMELLSIVDLGRHSPALDAEAFAWLGVQNWFWSSTAAAETTLVWAVQFKMGYPSASEYDDPSGVRCVR